jgi:hypothetical protein
MTPPVWLDAHGIMRSTAVLFNRLRVRASTRLRVRPALLAAWVLVLTIEAAPHLVHHLLDDDPPTCGFLGLLSDTPGLSWRVLDVPRPAARPEVVMCRPQVVSERVVCTPYGPRAPPHPAFRG